MILVDECRWWWREHWWCHMVSDDSLDELHVFAASIGVPERGFQGDHYDIPAHVREIAVESGAIVVTSRELVVRLRSAGLRLSPDQRRATSAAGQIADLTSASAISIPTTGAVQPIQLDPRLHLGSSIA